MDAGLEKKFFLIFTNAAATVYKQMMGETPKIGGIKKEEGSWIKETGIITIVAFNGKFSGRLLLAFDPLSSMDLHNKINEENETSVTDEVLFTHGEFGNMCAGSAITEINNQFRGANVRLAPPSVFSGKELTFFNFKMSQYSIVIKVGQGNLTLNVALKE